MSKFYKWAPMHSQKSDNHLFYKPNNAGYTRDLKQAGKYSEDEISDCDKVIKTDADYRKAMRNEKYHRIFAVPVDEVEILGQIQKTVRRK